MKLYQPDQDQKNYNRKNNCKTRIKMTKSSENWKTMIYKRFFSFGKFLQTFDRNGFSLEY